MLRRRKQNLPGDSRKALGKRGEELALNYLKKKRWRILERNYRMRSGEVDIVAWDGSTLTFVEVKSRSGTTFGEPHEAVDKRKQVRVSRAAKHYILVKKIKDVPMRFDVISILFDGDYGKVDHIRDAFQINSY